MNKIILFVAISMTSTFAFAQLDSMLGLKVDSKYSNTGDLEPASKKAIDEFIKSNPGGGGMPIFDPRVSYVAPSKRHCISGDCKVLREKLAQSWFITAAAFKVSPVDDKSINVNLEGAPFRSAFKGMNFNFIIDKTNVIDAENKTIYPLCSEDACISFKIHAAGKGDAMLLHFIVPGGKKKYVLFINTSTTSEADAGYEFKLMDDYYVKNCRSLTTEGQAEDPDDPDCVPTATPKRQLSSEDNEKKSKPDPNEHDENEADTD